MNLMEQFADPELMHGMTFGEKMAGAGMTTLMGMGITFIVLLFLWGCIALMARTINRSCGRMQETLAGGAVHRARRAAPAGIIPGDSQQTARHCFTQTNSPGVHLAVISAAVAAYESRSGGLSVRKIKRLSSRPVWSSEITERKVSR